MSYEIREYRPGDESAILETFNLVFGQNDPSFVPRTLEEWQWVFPQNPAGLRIFVAEHEGNIVAQAAGQPYRVWLDGEQHVIVNGVDSMTHPEHRRGLKRPGLFVRVALTFHEHFEAQPSAGRPASERGGDLMHFGLPIDQAARMGERFLGYRMIRIQMALARLLTDAQADLPDGVVPIERFDERVDALYARCRAGWGVSTIRDSAYLNWRYLDHPTRRYLPFGVFDDDDTLRGVFVYRHGDWVQGNMGFIVDWLVPEGEPEVAALLHRAALAQAKQDGAAGAGAIFPEWSSPFLDFQRAGWHVTPTGYCLRCRPTHLSVDWLRANWWYQLGDTDLF